MDDVCIGLFPLSLSYSDVPPILCRYRADNGDEMLFVCICRCVRGVDESECDCLMCLRWMDGGDEYEMVGLVVDVYSS